MQLRHFPFECDSFHYYFDVVDDIDVNVGYKSNGQKNGIVSDVEW